MLKAQIGAPGGKRRGDVSRMADGGLESVCMAVYISVYDMVYVYVCSISIYLSVYIYGI